MNIPPTGILLAFWLIFKSVGELAGAPRWYGICVALLGILVGLLVLIAH